MADAAVGHVRRVGDRHFLEARSGADAVADQAGFAAVHRGIVASVDVNAFRTVAIGARRGGDLQILNRGGWEVTVEIDTRLSVIASRNPEQVAIVVRRLGRAAGDSDGVVSATVVGQRRDGRDAGPRRPVGPIAALHRVVA